MKDIKEASDLYLKVMYHRLENRCAEIEEELNHNTIDSLNEGGFEQVARDEKKAREAHPELVDEFIRKSNVVLDIMGELYRRGVEYKSVN